MWTPDWYFQDKAIQRSPRSWRRAGWEGLSESLASFNYRNLSWKRLTRETVSIDVRVFYMLHFLMLSIWCHEWRKSVGPSRNPSEPQALGREERVLCTENFSKSIWFSLPAFKPAVTLKCCWQNNMSGAVLNFQHSSSLSLNRRACCRPSFSRTPDSDSPPALRVHSVSAAQEDMNRPGRTGREAGWQVTVILKHRLFLTLLHIKGDVTGSKSMTGVGVKKKKGENESGQWQLGVSMIKKRKTL